MQLRAAERIAAWRRLRGLNQKELAAAAGIHKATLFRIEKGHQEPRESELEAIASALDLTMVEFYGDIPQTNDAAAAS